MDEYLTPEDIQNILKVKKAKAYEIIRNLNDELKEEGFYTINGRVSKNKFEEKYIYKGEQ